MKPLIKNPVPPNTQILVSEDFLNAQFKSISKLIKAEANKNKLQK